MPIYEYRCDNGHTFEVLQRMADDRIAICESCEAPVQQVFHPIAVHFKGSGFYNTDYGTRNRSKETEAAAKAGKSDATSSDKKKAGEKAGTTTGKGEKSGGGGSQSANGKGDSAGGKGKS